MKPDFNSCMIHQQFKQQYYANLHSKHRGFKDGDPVYIRNFGPGTKWIPGQVLSSDGSVSFNVSLQGGKTVRRHTDHIRSRTEQQICVPIIDERNQDTTDETPISRLSNHPIRHLQSIHHPIHHQSIRHLISHLQQNKLPNVIPREFGSLLIVLSQSFRREKL